MSSGPQQAKLQNGINFAIASLKNGSTNELDLHMQMQVPEHYGWGAVGIGKQMAGAMIFLTYPSADGKGSTLSFRNGVGHIEPEPAKTQPCRALSSSMSTGKTIDTSFICYGLGEMPSLKDNSESNWIFSAGPGATVKSNSVDAEIERHPVNTKGFFTVDMVKAQHVPQPIGGGSKTGSGNIPMITGGGSSAGVTVTADTSPPENLILTHSILLGGCFLVLFPLGVVLLRLRSVRLHWMLQSFAFLLSVIAFIVAIYMSASTTEYSAFTESHQILGIVTVVLLFPQFILGSSHHRVFKTKGKSWLSYPHVNLGRIVLILGMVNGILGFKLSDDNNGAIGYGVGAGVVIVALAGLAIWDYMRGSKQSTTTYSGGEMTKSTSQPKETIHS